MENVGGKGKNCPKDQREPGSHKFQRYHEWKGSISISRAIDNSQSLLKTKPQLATVWLVSLNSLTLTPCVAKSISYHSQFCLSWFH